MSFPHLPKTSRKRVVAREVEAANADAATLSPELVSPPVAPAGEQVVVVDPTTLGRRYRRSSHHRVYRWTQLTTMLAGVVATVSVIFTMADDVIVGRILAGCGVGVGVVATILAGRTSLSARLRGWAMAALVFACASLALTWIHAALTKEDPSELNPRSRQAVRPITKDGTVAI